MKNLNSDFLGDNAEELISWFSEQYLLTKEICSTILINATIKYRFTANELKEGCQILKMRDDGSLSSHIKAIGEMGNCGMSAAKAGAEISKILY